MEKADMRDRWKMFIQALLLKTKQQQQQKQN